MFFPMHFATLIAQAGFGDSFGPAAKQAAIVAAVLLAVAAIGGIAYLSWRSRHFQIDEYEVAAPSSTKYEQVLAELQGIKLMIARGDGRRNVSKVGRLARIVINREGVEGGLDLDIDTLRKNLDGNVFTPHQVEVLIRVLERCETAADPHVNKLDFEPIEMITEFRSLIYEIEGPSQA